MPKKKEKYVTVRGKRYKLGKSHGQPSNLRTTRRKGGQRLVEIAKEGGIRRRAKAKAAKDAKVASVSDANRLISGAPKITYKPKPSPHLKPKTATTVKKTTKNTTNKC